MSTNSATPGFADEEGGWPLILVVDDVEDNRRVLSRRLMAAGFRCETCPDGPSAIARLASGQLPDAVLMDYMMPDMSGVDAVKILRETWSIEDLPVLMVTARDDDPTLVKSFNAGANDYITKPISFAILVARLKFHLRGKLPKVA